MICRDKSSFGSGLDLNFERQTSCPLLSEGLVLSEGFVLGER